MTALRFNHIALTNWRSGEQHISLLLLQGLQEGLWLELGQRHHLDALRHLVEHDHGERVDVEERQDRHHGVLVRRWKGLGKM